jgi:hypothetical protein
MSIDKTREYELITEAHAQLSVIQNCSRSSLRVSMGGGEQLEGGGWSAVAGGGGRDIHRGRTQRHAVGAKVRVFVRNPDEFANERAELARLLNKAGTCFLHETSLSTASGRENLEQFQTRES